MELENELSRLLNCTIRFTTKEGEYEGFLETIFSSARMINVRKCILLPDIRKGPLRFAFSELSNIRVINRAKVAEDKSLEKKLVLPVYPKTDVEKLFDFDEGSDIEDGECLGDQQEAYEMKLLPRFSKLVPCDFDIIESFNKDFSSAIKHIKTQDTIGVSLEGVKIGRSGTLTWLCISTKSCNFLFDILSLGEEVFKKGLKSILENARIQKIFHDCRLASDCLYHKYGVRLVNVFDTQVADFIVMMQMIPKERVSDRVNTLDALLEYYLEVPSEYLYGDANFDSNEDSLNFHALRPLRHDIQDVLIKNVMYLHVLKKELEVALMTPLRRATDVYLNSVQKLKESELLIVPHEPGKLPLDMHLDGIQIFRYKDFDNAVKIATSGPPYRKINNPPMSYLKYCSEYEKGQKNDKVCAVNKDALENIKMTSKDNCTASQRASKPRSDMRSVGVISLNKWSEYNQDSSDDSKENQISRCPGTVKPKCKSSPSSKAIDNRNTDRSLISETLKFSECSTVKNPVMSGLVKPLARTANNHVKANCNKSSEVSNYNSQALKETMGADNKVVLQDLTNVSKLSNSKIATNPSVSNDVSKTESSQIFGPVLRRKSPRELLEYFSKMKQSLKSTTSEENSVDDNISTSGSVCKNRSVVEVDESTVKGKENICDSNFEDIAARVRARGALLCNQKTERSSTPDAFNRGMADKPVKDNNRISPENVEPTSEDVTVFYSETLDKPSQFAVKIKHNNSYQTKQNVRLIDLYKEAGDRSMWMEEESESVSMSSPIKHNESTDTENFWEALLGDVRRKPVDEKLRLRLIPAGMSGF